LVLLLQRAHEFQVSQINFITGPRTMFLRCLVLRTAVGSFAEARVRAADEGLNEHGQKQLHKENLI
jgi:hypothetical protein